jgi:RHS repeat-associated protein
VTPTATTTATSTATHTAIPIPPEPVTIDYLYDPLYRLTEANYSTGDYYHYTYDSVGNRLTEESKIEGLLSAVDYAYDEANRLTSVDNVAYTWDANGNLLNDGANTYTYDSANRLISVNGTESYTYNGLGDRLTQNNVHYTLDLNAGLTQVLEDGENTYLYGNGRISQTGTSTEYFLGDALGSVRQLTNEAAEITLTKAYEPYGEEAWSYGEGQSDYGFAAEWTDANGLIHLRARYYAPADGRFLSRDTWEGDENNPITYNKWTYANANPVMYTDPSGQLALLAAMGVGFVAGVAIGAAVGYYDRGWALSGQCGCDIQEIAQSTGDFEWIGYHALVGGLIGGSAPILAAIAAASPLGAIAIGGIGVVLGGKDLYDTAQIIINEQKGHPTWCTGIRAAVDILAIVFGGATAVKGWKAGVAAWRSSGSLLSWIAPSLPKWIGGVNFGDYNPQTRPAFSGVYNPESGNTVIRPSGNTRLANGQTPDGIVPRAGGHRVINETFFNNSNKTVGYTVFYDKSNGVTIEWLSRSVNGANYGDPFVPLQFRSTIIAIFEALGFVVTTR